MIASIEWDGAPITKPGMYSRVPINVYHSRHICDGHAVSSSDLRACFSKSPAHAFDRWSGNPGRVEQEEKRHFVVGRAMHHLILGEPFFAKVFAAQPETYTDEKTGEIKPWNGNAGACKKWRKEQDDEGRSILKPEDVSIIRGMARAIGTHPFIKHSGLLNGQIERSIFFKDKPTGLWIKVRPDNIPPSNDFVDLKTTDSVQWNDLQRTIFDYGYHQQGALICRAAREVLKIEKPTFTLVFVEKKRPYCVRTVEIKENDLALGEQANRKAIDAFAQCIESGFWPGPGGERDDAAMIEMPEWAQKLIKDRIEFGVL